MGLKLELSRTDTYTNLDIVQGLVTLDTPTPITLDSVTVKVEGVLLFGKVGVV